MRKILLGTTALVAAGMFAGTAFAADPIKITVGGYMEQWFGVVTDDVGERPADRISGTTTVNSLDWDQQSDSEIWFTGKTKLDNGVEIGLTVELEANTGADVIDESYGTVEYAGWRFVIGSENGAGYLMQYSAPDVGIGFNSGDQVNWIPFGGNATAGYYDGALGTTYLRVGDNDAQKVMLFTPRWLGFQVGVSYAPDYNEDGAARTNINSAAANAAGFGGGAGGNGVAGNSNIRNGYNNAWTAGANYVNKFDELSVALAVGYATAKAPNLDGGAAAASPSGVFGRFGADDIKSWSAGLNLGWGNFLIGGSFAAISDGMCLATGPAASATLNACTATTSGQGWDVGARYIVGPWAISAMYFHGEQEGVTVGAGGNGVLAAVAGVASAAVLNNAASRQDDEQETYAVSLRYTMGPGIEWRSSLFLTDFDSEFRGTAADLSNSGWALVTGLRLSF
ncbi:MAG: porin [Alphaproteobacteria bacterium]|nr:porin [Alphaproteobacteria bacterium]